MKYKMNINFKIIYIALLLIFVVPTFAVFDLSNYVSPEPIAMGAAFSAMDGNIHCIDINPAGLHNFDNFEIEYSRVNPYNISNLSANKILMSLPNILSNIRLGVSYFNLNYDDIYSENAFNLSVSYTVVKNIILGTKVLFGKNAIDFNNFEEYSVNKSVYPFSLSFGGLYILKKLNFSILVNNLLSLKYNDTDRLPLNAVVGLKYGISDFIITMDYSINRYVNGNKYDNDIGIGAKYNISKRLSLLAGYHSGDISGGIKIHFNNITIYYTILIPENLGVSHYYGLNFKL